MYNSTNRILFQLSKKRKKRNNEVSVKNTIRGLKAKRQGEDWENYFKNTIEENSKISIYKMPSLGAKYIGPNQCKTSPIISDFIIGYKGQTALIDIKSREGKTFPFSDIHEKPHQLPDLIKFFQNGNGCNNAGFVVFFITLKQIIFYDVFKLDKIKPRESLKPEDGWYLGEISLNPNNEIKYENIFV